MRISSTARIAVILLAVMAIFPTRASAALFEDDEARKAILDVRAKLETKADKSGLLELANQNDLLRQEVARLRGQVEMLANEVNNAQRRQKDFYVELDNRTRRLEPQRAVIDGKEVLVDPAEQNAYDAAMAQLKAGSFKAASAAFSDFLRQHPRSGYAASAQYFLGSAFYAQRDYRNAISAQTVVLKRHAQSEKVPDAMLNIASCYTEMKNNTSAKKMLEKLIAQYPKSEAAKTARERLGKK